MSQISYHGSGEGGESDDSEGENQELAQIDRGEFPRFCTLRISAFVVAKALFYITGVAAFV